MGVAAECQFPPRVTPPPPPTHPTFTTFKNGVRGIRTWVFHSASRTLYHHAKMEDESEHSHPKMPIGELKRITSQCLTRRESSAVGFTFRFCDVVRWSALEVKIARPKHAESILKCGEMDAVYPGAETNLVPKRPKSHIVLAYRRFGGDFP